ncbi:outer membrane protein [Mesorhizobium sp. ZMM04-5]|uniref:Outer membrane protein n=1 Tax=Mesorhizobium marinum TaxID=3228790 RepID=A0ABV3R6G7_9HYPH
MRNTLIVVALACTASVAHAADAVVYEPAEVISTPVFSWTGGYIGLQAGYLWGDSHMEFLSDGSYGNPDPHGWLGGVYVGYNYEMPSNVVLGIEADIAYADAEGDREGFGFSGIPAPPGDGLNMEVNWSGAVRGRLGYALDRLLPYIAGGVAFADVDSSNVLAPVTFNDSDTMVGWTVGIGGEYAFTDQLIGRVEYRYTDFGSSDLVLDSIDGAAEADLTTSDVRFGLAWKF